jgi:hypothetical protein
MVFFFSLALSVIVLSAAKRNFTETAGLKVCSFFRVLLPTSCPGIFFLLPSYVVISWCGAALKRNSRDVGLLETHTSPSESRARKP